MRTTMMAGMAALLFSLPVAAQQATPQTPAPSGTPAPRGPGAGPMGGPGGQGMMGGQDQGRMGMMGRPAMHDEDEDEDEDHGGPMLGTHHGHRRHAAPMQVIINIGPDNRVEFEQREAHAAGMGHMGGPMTMGGEMRGRSMADRIEAHLDYLRGELQLRPEQQQAWDRFASAVREAVGRVRPSFEAMAQAQTVDQRLTAQEGVLTARLEAVRAIHSALSGLTSSLNDAQRRTLDEHAAAFMPGMGRMRAGMMH